MVYTLELFFDSDMSYKLEWSTPVHDVQPKLAFIAQCFDLDEVQAYRVVHSVRSGHC